MITLRSVFSSILPGYMPVIEIVNIEGCEKRGEEGIWDVLGKYYPSTRAVVMCEKELHETSQSLTQTLDLSPRDAYFITRFLVQIHEHAHAYTHQIVSEMKLQYLKLKKEFHEQLAEFLTRIAAEFVDDDIFIKIFDELDKHCPNYYREWRKLYHVVQKTIATLSEEDEGIGELVKKKPLGKLLQSEELRKVIDIKNILKCIIEASKPNYSLDHLDKDLLKHCFKQKGIILATEDLL